jgi:hypothetical protein
VMTGFSKLTTAGSEVPLLCPAAEWTPAKANPIAKTHLI